MAASISQTVEARSTGTTSLVSPSFTSVSGDALIVSVHCSTSSTIATPTDSNSNSWTLIGTAQTSSGQQAVYLAQNIVGGTGHTITVAFSTSEAASFFIQEATGVLASCYDSGSLIQGTNAGASCSVTTGTLAQANSIVLSLVGSGLGSPITFSETSGFHVDGSESAGNTYWPGACGSKVVSATTALTSTWTSVNSTNLTVTAFALKAAPTNGLGKPLNVQGPLFARMALPNAGDTTIGPPQGTSLALTGVTGTGSSGTVAPAVDKPLTAVTGTGSVGTVVPNVSPALTGVSATGSAGTVVPSATAALSAVTGSGSAGSVGANVSVGLTGVTGTGSVGTVTASQGIFVALTGVTGTGSVGTVVPNIDTALTSVTGTGSAGTVGPVVAPALAAVSSTGSAGTLSPVTVAALTALSATGSVTAPGASIQIGLTGVTGTGSVGTVTAVVGGTSIALTGVSATGSVSAPGVDIQVGLTGVSATGMAGTVAPPSTNIGGNPWGYGKKKNRAQIQAEVNRLNLEILKAELAVEAKAEIELVSTPWADEEDEIEMLLLA